MPAKGRDRDTRIRFLGDLHCGHRAGLTPPAWWPSEEADPHACRLLDEMWLRWRDLCTRLPKPDWCVVNGDAIDGRGERTGGAELLAGCADRTKQAEMALDCLSMLSPRRGWKMTRGTPYHTGECEEYENILAGKLGAEISDRLNLECGPWIFDVRHALGGTSVPYGKTTAISREHIWDMLWGEWDCQKPENVIIRSHLHWACHVWEPTWQGWVLPALQGPLTRFGSLRCSNVVHWGVVDAVVSSKGVLSWEPSIIRLASAARHRSKL